MATDSYPVVSVKLRPIDERTMEVLEAHELLSRSDIVRRALRSYARTLGLEVPEPKRRQPKPKKQ